MRLDFDVQVVTRTRMLRRLLPDLESEAIHLESGDAQAALEQMLAAFRPITDGRER